MTRAWKDLDRTGDGEEYQPGDTGTEPRERIMKAENRGYKVASLTRLLTPILLSVRCSAAFLSPIADCDETFNYWEPMHYVLFGYGFQTWEYSPQFALRSYAYLFPYAAVAKTGHWIHSELIHQFPWMTSYSPKITAFYTVRICLGLLCAVSELSFAAAIRTRFGAKSGRLFLVFAILSPGMYRTAVEFLPSSFAMVTLMFAFSAWMRSRFNVAVFCVALATMLGWVFAAVLAVPIAIHLLISPGGIAKLIASAATSAFAILAVMVPIDSFYFGKLVVAPLKHILYNVFPRHGTGSQIFGVEPWSFYAMNLILNFNISAILFAGYPILAILLSIWHPGWWRDRTVIYRRVTYLSAPYIAIAVFLAQPHKEERFLAPCYPLIALIAAIATVDFLSFAEAITDDGNRPPRRIRTGKITSVGRTTMSLAVGLACPVILGVTAALSGSRIYMQVHAFHAPLALYRHLSEKELLQRRHVRTTTEDVPNINVCIGKEWYRFPTTFFLPTKIVRPRFIRSGPAGMLPQLFDEGPRGSRASKDSMNEFNRPDDRQFYNWKNESGCHYFVDLDLHHRGGERIDRDEESPIIREDAEVIVSVPFLDIVVSPAGLRAFFVPGLQSRLTYGTYQILRNTEMT